MQKRSSFDGKETICTAHSDISLCVYVVVPLNRGIFQIDGTGKECMTSILLSEHMREDGTVLDEQVMSDAAATVFLGEPLYCITSAIY